MMKATKKSVEVLRKVYECLAPCGGEISLVDCKIFAPLDFEIGSTAENPTEAVIGFCEFINGDIVYDPQFELLLSISNGVIEDVEVKKYISTIALYSIEVDEAGIVYRDGCVTGEKTSLKKLFSDFIKQVEIRYLKSDIPFEVKKYDTAWDESC